MSLRNRLIIGLGVVLVTLGISMVVIVSIQREYLLDHLDRQLRSGLPFASGPPAPLQDELPPEVFSDIDSSLSSPVSEIYVGVLNKTGPLLPIIEGQMLEDTPDVTQADVVDLDPDGEAFTVEGVATTERFRVMAVRRPDGESWGVVALPLSQTEGASRQLLVTLGAASLVILVVLALTSWWMVRLGLRPIARVTEAADAIAAGERGHRVALDDPRTEAGRLGQAFNVMLDERDEDEARLRQFVADASHELRTPLTSIRGYLEIYANGGFREPDELEDVVRRMRSEAMRMNDLVEDLLLLANLDQGRPMASEPVDLADVLRDAADDGRAMEPSRPITVLLPDTGALVVPGDEARLRQLVAALVHNAVVHTPPTVPITLKGQLDADGAVMSIIDEGPGLDAELAKHVFDRFSRGDESRSRHAGGSGLGLPIAQSIVEAHGGSITLVTAPGEGCRFDIRLSTTVPRSS